MRRAKNKLIRLSKEAFEYLYCEKICFSVSYIECSYSDLGVYENLSVIYIENYINRNYTNVSVTITVHLYLYSCFVDIGDFSFMIREENIEDLFEKINHRLNEEVNF